MGNLICTSSSSSKGNSTAQIADSSIWCPQPGQHISIQTFRELNPAPTSSHTSRKTGTPSNGECSRSTGEVLGVVNKRPTTQPPRL
uniref:AC4 n=1 Tax=Tomato chlorotic leaf curl virus TaxID=2015441 RepID=A0A218MXV6_9GEMI|nr:AC4 [Tomato chlorotic leaf curl virus]